MKRIDRGTLTRRGTVVELVAPQGSFDAVTRVAVHWDGSAAFVETWPVEFLIVLDEEAKESA